MRRAFGCLVLGLVSVIFVNSGQLVIDPRVLSAETELTLEGRVTSLETRVAALERPAGVTPVGKREEFFKSMGEGSGAWLDWVKVSGSDFDLDPSLYGNITEVSWQGWLEVKDGNGVGFARIYDSTNKRGVDGSEIRILSGVKSSFYSQPMSIWRGINSYYVQVKSSSGYQVSITGPKLKIVVN